MLSWLRKRKYRKESAGEGVFFVLKYMPTKKEERELVREAKQKFEDVQWCPDPELHGSDAVAVLNCFYPRQRRKSKRKR